MMKLLIGLATAFSLFIGSAYATGIRPGEPVLNEQTAIEIAKASWRSVYGPDKIKDGGSLFRAKLYGDMWIVTGNMEKTSGIINHGGTVITKISKIDGHIIASIHGK